MSTSYPRLALAGLSAGSLSSLVGLGGGFVLTPLLTSATAVVKGGMKQRNAQATVLASIGFSSIGAAGGYLYSKAENGEKGEKTGAAGERASLNPSRVKFGSFGSPLSAQPALPPSPSFLSSIAPPFLSSIVSNPSNSVILHDAFFLSLGGLCLSPFGARLARSLDNAKLKKMMGWVMIGVGPTVPLRSHIEAFFTDPDSSTNETDDSASPSSPSSPSQTLLSTSLPPLLIGSLSGFLAGLLGVGGGAITVPLISLLHAHTPNYQYTDALATSLLAMPAPALVATLSQLDLVALPIAATLASCSAAGGAGTARIVEGMDEGRRKEVEEGLRWMFCGLMWALGVRFVR